MGANTIQAVGAKASLRQRWWKQVVRFCQAKPLGAFGAVVLIMVVLAAIFAPLLAPYDQLTQNAADRLQAPSLRHLAGTDEFGRDLFSRLLFGARVSLYVGILSVLFGSLVGVVVGLVSAYFGGRLDLVAQRVVDIMLGFPALVLAMVLVASLGGSLNNVMIAIAVVFAPRVARIARSAAMSIRENDYVLAAIALGASNPRILARYILPNSLAPIIVLCTAYLGTAIVTEASLSFLGLGVPPPHPSWGRMLQGAARQYTESAPWMVAFPGLAVTLTVFGFNLFGDALRDILDPRLRSR